MLCGYASQAWAEDTLCPTGTSQVLLSHEPPRPTLGCWGPECLRQKLKPRAEDPSRRTPKVNSATESIRSIPVIMPTPVNNAQATHPHM